MVSVVVVVFVVLFVVLFVVVLFVVLLDPESGATVVVVLDPELPELLPEDDELAVVFAVNWA